MPSHRELFFELPSFVVIGNSAAKPFPRLTYNNLRLRGKKVFPLDLGGVDEVEGDANIKSLDALPEEVAGAIVEVPRDQTLDVVEAVERAGIRQLWLHMKSESPEVLAFCEEKRIDVRWGTCAVMYTQQGFSFHSIHKAIMKLLGKY